MTTGSENSALGDAGDKNNVPSYCKTRRGLCYPLVLFCFVCFHISSESGIYLTDQGPGVMTVGFCLVVFFFFKFVIPVLGVRVAFSDGSLCSAC